MQNDLSHELIEKLADAVAERLRDVQEQPLLVCDEEAARLLGVSRRTFRTLVSSEELPKPLKLRGRSLWRRLDIEGYVRRLAESN